MKNLQENLATLIIWSGNVTTSTREFPTCAWIRVDICRQYGTICSKNRKIVPYHTCARIPRLTVSVPDYGSCYNMDVQYQRFIYSNDATLLFFKICGLAYLRSYGQSRDNQNFFVIDGLPNFLRNGAPLARLRRAGAPLIYKSKNSILQNEMNCM